MNPTDQDDRLRWVHRHRHWLTGVAATVLFLGLALLASLPTGGDGPSDAITDGSRLAASERMDDDTVVQILSSGRGLSAQVAYRGPKGWLGARLTVVDADTVASSAATGGAGPVPALSIVYGRAPADAVTVTWTDGTVDDVTVESDGVYVAVRAGRHASASVVFHDATGAVVLEVEGP